MKTFTLALTFVLTACGLGASSAKAQDFGYGSGPNISIGISSGYSGGYYGYPVVPPPVIVAPPPVVFAPPPVIVRPPYYGGYYRGYPYRGGFGYRGGYGGPYRGGHRPYRGW